MTFAVYPVITSLLYALGPFTENWPLWQRTMLLAPIMVAAIIFVVTPLVMLCFRRFVMVHHPRWENRKQAEPPGSSPGGSVFLS